MFIAGITIAFAATIEIAITKDYSTYMAARVFQGLGVSPTGTVGMAIIGEQVQLEEVPRWILTICL